MPVGVKMLLSWGSNYKHDKGSVYSSDLQLLLQLRQIHICCTLKDDINKAIQDFLVYLYHLSYFSFC
jgi:hypothetical protein